MVQRKHAVALVLAAILAIAAGAGCSSENNIVGGTESRAVDNPAELRNPVQTDIVTQVVPPSVDVLWVIDDSCSMSCIVGCHGSVSDKVAENFPLFMDYFLGSGLDYHIGVVTADLDSPSASGRLQYGRGEKFIDKSTPDPQQVFFDMAAQGTDGGGVERGLGATYTAIELLGDSVNSGFYRDRAALHTIVLSDEEDQTRPSLLTRDEFVDWYDGLKVTEERTFSAIVCQQAGEACPEGPASTYLQTAQEIGGIVWDIERDDWADLLDQLGAQAAGLRREYFLSRLPVEDTLEVQVEEADGVTLAFDRASGDPPDGDWLYDEVRNSITFLEYVPGPGARVVLTYTVASSVVESP